MHLELRNAYLKINSPSLQDLIKGAIAKAQNLDRSVILTYSYAWENIDPLFFLSQKSQPGQSRFYWEQPQQKLAIAAGGMVLTLPQFEPQSKPQSKSGTKSCSQSEITTEATPSAK
jgi:isochorismate synthase EntC